MWVDGEWHGPFIKALLNWLGYDGVAFFTMVQDEYGTLNAAWPLWIEKPPTGVSRLQEAILKAQGKWGYAIPHSVHFREGMAVRNKMRQLHQELGYPLLDAHGYDDTWQGAIKACLYMCETGRAPVYGPEE